jgi:hypothetical protein
MAIQRDLHAGVRQSILSCGRLRSGPASFKAGASPQRPDLAPGHSINPILGGPNKYFDPAAFALPAPGYYGTPGRNTLIGPGLIALDLAANKTFRLREGLNLQFRTEVFNSLR